MSQGQLWAFVLTALVSLFTGAYLQGRGTRLSSWYASRAAMQDARRTNYSDLIRAVTDFVHINERRGLAPGFVPPRPGLDSTDEGRQALEAAQRVDAALAQILIVSQVDTWEAGRAWADLALSLVELGHYALADDDPLRQQRADARERFIDLARRDLNVAPIGVDYDRLNWLQLRMLRVPRLRDSAWRRAFDSGQQTPSGATDSPGNS